jgi:large subunit ribosomal protein L3
MTQLFNAEGQSVPCTVIEVESNLITQVKTTENDGYNAIQLASNKTSKKDQRWKRRRTSKAIAGHYAKANVETYRDMHETRVESTEGFELGQAITVDQFEDVQFVDIVGTSKGKGFQGVMKLHGFSGGPGSHGSGFHRHAGSTGMRSPPGRCLPGGKRASQMGNRRVTTEALEVIKVDKERNLLIVKGCVPGAAGGTVTVRESVKKRKPKK